jgi:hypothetical protein
MCKAREKMVNEIRARMGEDTMCYDTISSLNKRSTLAPDLLGGPKGPDKTLRGLVDMGDGRVPGGLQLNFSSKRIVCTSFDRDWKCLRCGGHGQEPAFKIRAVANSSSPRQVVVLADQTFPAILPADGQARCMQIILVENGSIPDIIDEFQKQLGNRRMPPGSVLLIFSASHLLNVGLAQYTADLVEGIKTIEGKFGKETIVQPLPTIFLDGTDNEELIRTILELNEWVVDYFGSANNFLEEANKTAREVIAGTLEMAA